MDVHDVPNHIRQSFIIFLLIGFIIVMPPVATGAETEELIDNARDKLERKNLDYIVANDVSGENTGMDADDNAVTVLGRTGEPLDIPRASKTVVAERVLDHLFSDLAGSPE